MEISVSKANWTMALAKAIEEASDGDTIICHSDAMKEMGERARERMCPGKQVTFKIAQADDLG